MKLLTVPLLALLLLSTGCNQERAANRGFSLPPGDAEIGELLFTEHRCIECHIIAGTEFVGDDEDRLTEGGGIAVKLGGEKTKVQTYGDLVTSVINPSHRIAKGYTAAQVIDENGESRMTYYNEVLTVAELIDLVTFLKSKYKLKAYPETTYINYMYGG